MEWIELITRSIPLLVVLLIAFLLFVLFKALKELSFFKRLLNQPIKYPVVIDNQQAMETILALLPKLNINEKQLLITRMFGRSCRFVTSMDTNGQSVLEIVKYWESEGENDFNFHYEQSRDRKEVG